MHPKHLSINDFSYDLPDDKIAKYPLPERDQSKLLIWKKGEIKEDIYKNIAEYIPEDSLLIFNNTKVIPARILFKKETGGVIEIFCLEPYVSKNSTGEEIDYLTVMNKRGSTKWKCMIGGASKWKGGILEKEIFIHDEAVKVSARLIERFPDAYITEISWQPQQFTFSEIIEYAGEIPLPPYIKRDAEEEDKKRYQTIYAEQQGSVAAPTAGLHFTSAIFSSLKNKKIKTDFVTLHVGAGTFKPVKSVTMEQHEMHAEWIDVSISMIKNVLENIKNIVAVGTTSLRTIESLYWMGLKCYLNNNCTAEELIIKQWEVYERPLVDHQIDVTAALNSLVNWMQKNDLQKLFIKTQILIAPGYQFRIVKSLVTNFHQPKLTLLLLIAAITKDWKKIYEYALKNNFRFLSYGDGCLLFL